ncbi:MAG TPA: TonB-dependent receptor plug domain-containing protein, partial [Flavitalea sp.]|nr:TonB-dependent receptor plug domain-containing protein [Flavitalea sp.]
MKLVFIFLLVIVANNSYAQSRAIQVVASPGFEPVAGATIQWLASGIKQVSNETGHFKLGATDTGNVIVSAVGYITDTFSTRFHRMVLKKDEAVLGEVVVSGTMRTVRKSASAIAVESYSPKFFLKNPTPSLFDALQLVNGIRPQLNCNVCNTGDIHINGMEGPYTLILIDGMPIVSSLASVYGLSGIPNALVEWIEVVKGPASSLYGSEAMGGLINVITKNPMKAPVASFDLSGTSMGEYSADVAFSYQPSSTITGLLGVNGFY